jgi:hypothetical protein
VSSHSPRPVFPDNPVSFARGLLQKYLDAMKGPADVKKPFIEHDYSTDGEADQERLVIAHRRIADQFFRMTLNSPLLKHRSDQAGSSATAITMTAHPL